MSRLTAGRSTFRISPNRNPKKVFSIEFCKPAVFIIAAIDCRSVADKSIEHHCSVHKIIIGSLSAPHFSKRLVLGSRDRPVPDPDSLAVPAVRAMAVHGNIAIGTGNRDTLFLLIPLEFQSLHSEKVL
jgi:hypothetical protein